MPTPTMSGKEFAGRMIALEAVVLAVAGELVATLPADKQPAIFAMVKQIATDVVDAMAPAFAPTPPVVKEIEGYANQYAETWIDMLGKAVAKIRKEAAAKPAG